MLIRSWKKDEKHYKKAGKEEEQEDEEERKKKKKKRYCQHSEINQVPNIIWMFIILLQLFCSMKFFKINGKNKYDSCFFCLIFTLFNFQHHVSFLSSVQLLSRVLLFVTPWNAACQASQPITNSWSLLKLMFMELVMPYNQHLILCHPLFLPPSILTSIRIFSNESVLHIRLQKF